ncbi:pantoate--beta-alanine ligase [Catenovulum sediminis]|uniref:Pantothenate synthetase n=1 Tax=Catenovulum sediminis TaxID=1740262 RepID=A0ABV1RK75_9ALTE|nr:pantoate--beta-alanine ligase [Catenovulum sediminis]
MQTISSIESLRQTIRQFKQNGQRVAFVPTMGNLHQGHLELVKRAFSEADKVVVSIFVNPMQFGQNEDLDNYPRTLEADQQALSALGVDLLFTPTPQIMYPKGLDAQTFVEVPAISENYCGTSRPGHFRGVATIVNKLFNLVQPDVACFGEKDFQQLQVIRTMVEDLSMPIKIIGVPTVREKNGLAKSSRNGYLTEAQKEQAGIIYHCMQSAKTQLLKEKTSIQTVQQQLANTLETAGLRLDYIAIADTKSLQPATADNKSWVILVAAYMGNTRLIDNLVIENPNL